MREDFALVEQKRLKTRFSAVSQKAGLAAQSIDALTKMIFFYAAAYNSCRLPASSRSSFDPIAVRSLSCMHA